MRAYKSILFFIFCAYTSLSAASDPSLKSLYHSIDPQSIPQNSAFYTLYPESPEGKQALNRVWSQLTGQSSSETHFIDFNLSLSVVNQLIELVNKPAMKKMPLLSDQELEAIASIGKHLKNRHLKGSKALSETEVINLPTEEVDLARGLLLSQLKDDEDKWKKIRSYEAMLDLMALQVNAKMGHNPSPEEMIKALNAFVFFDLEFAFPPHSLYAKDIDEYTFLPSVLDSRKGVCLGVSILYMCLAQRIGLKLELVTPPGHIYVRYRNSGKTINIETTARGIHIDDDDYLGINTTGLQERTVKETIGLAHFNQASVYWGTGNPQKAYESYQIAKHYLKNDSLLSELEAYSLLAIGKKQEGLKQLKEISKQAPSFAMTQDSLCEDCLNGQCNGEAILAILKHVDEKRSSILEKKKIIESYTKKFPKFKSGYFHLAIAHLQLHNTKEAIQSLEKYHQLDAGNPNVEYFLAALYLERGNYPKAWQHFDDLQTISKSHHHEPKELKRLQRALNVKSKR